MNFSVDVNVKLSASSELLVIFGRFLNVMASGAAVIPANSPETPKFEIPVAPAEASRFRDEVIPARQPETKEVTEPEQVDSTRRLYTEAEAMDLSVDVLTDLLSSYGVSLVGTEGKNTNRKLRLMLMKAQEENEEGSETPKEVAEEEEATTEEPETVEAPKDAPKRDVVRSLIVEKVNGGFRESVRSLLADFDAKNISDISDEDLAAFHAKLQKIKE